MQIEAYDKLLGLLMLPTHLKWLMKTRNHIYDHSILVHWTCYGIHGQHMYIAYHKATNTEFYYTLEG